MRLENFRSIGSRDKNNICAHSKGAVALLQDNNSLAWFSSPTSLPWGKIKEQKKSYFNWLQAEGICLTWTNFQIDKLSATGCFFGAHPDITCWDDYTRELKPWLNLPADIQFQLTSKPMHISLNKGGTIKFHLCSIIVKCDGKHVGCIHDAMFDLGDPKTVR